MDFFNKLLRPVNQGNNSYYPQTPDQLRARIERVFYQLHTQLGETIKANCYGSLVEKQKKHFGQEYISQLERNVIYLNLLARNFQVATASYLREGRQVIGAEAIENYMDTKCLMPSLEETPFHLAFLNQGCSGCRFHSVHHQYQYLKNFRKTLSLSDYVYELEPRYVYGKASQQFAELLLRILLNNREFVGLARKLTFQDTLEVVQNRVNIHSNFVLGWHESN